jgi:PAS domain S-box-containing protein
MMPDASTTGPDAGATAGEKAELELRRTIRDMVAISALPAIWSGKGAAPIAESLADLLLTTLDLELIYIRTPGSREGEPIEVALRRNKPFPPGRVKALGLALEPWLEKEDARTGKGIVNPVGSGTIYPAVVRFGRGDAKGALFAGSTRPGFPTERDRLILGVGANHMIVMQQRDLAEAALRESESRFRRLADSAPVMIWVSDADGKVIFESEQWYRFTGQAPGSALGGGWLECIHPTDRAAIEARWKDANRNSAETREEYRLRRNDGEYRWVLDAAVPRLGEEGEFLGFVGSVIDITDRKLTEQKLTESERRYAMVTELIPQLLWTSGADGKPDYFNQRWYEYTGLARGTLETEELITHPDDRPRVVAAWEKALRDGTPFETEHRIRRADGTYEWFLAQALPEYDKKGKIVKWYGSLTNVDAQRRSRER